MLHLIIIGIAVLSLIGYLIQRYNSSSDIKTGTTLAKNEVERAKLWKECMEKSISSEGSDFPGLYTLQTVSSALSFPKFDPIVVEYLHQRVIDSYLKKLEDRIKINPQAHNLEIIEKFIQRFPRLPKSRIEKVKNQIEKAGELFNRFCSGDQEALLILKQHKDMQAVISMIENLRFNVYNYLFEYMKAACEARQSVLRLFLSPEEESAAGTVGDVICASLSQKVGFAIGADIRSMKSSYAEALKNNNCHESRITEWAILGNVFNSPRWSYFPVLKGEKFCYFGMWHSDDVAITNAMIVYLISDKHLYSGVPLSCIKTVERDKKDRKSLLVNLSKDDELHIPYRGGGVFKALKNEIGQGAKNEPYPQLNETYEILIKQARAVEADASQHEIEKETCRCNLSSSTKKN